MTWIDKKIGKNIKYIRKSCGLSQIELAEKVGISFQQIQKYEKGVTKISIFRLQQVSEALGIHITDFFKERELTPKVSDLGRGYASEEIPFEHYQRSNQDEVLFLKLFRRIKNKKLREGLLKQMRGIIELEKKK